MSLVLVFWLKIWSASHPPSCPPSKVISDPWRDLGGKPDLYLRDSSCAFCRRVRGRVKRKKKKKTLKARLERQLYQITTWQHLSKNCDHCLPLWQLTWQAALVPQWFNCVMPPASLWWFICFVTSDAGQEVKLSSAECQGPAVRLPPPNSSCGSSPTPPKMC